MFVKFLKLFCFEFPKFKGTCCEVYPVNHLAVNDVKAVCLDGHSCPKQATLGDATKQLTLWTLCTAVQTATCSAARPNG